MKYSELLKRQEWISFRDKILERDKVCQLCKGRENLHVHHLTYFKSAKPWQYPESMLIVLCNKCHKQEHEYYNLLIDLISFMRAKGMKSSEILNTFFESTFDGDMMEFNEFRSASEHWRNITKRLDRNK